MMNILDQKTFFARFLSLVYVFSLAEAFVKQACMNKSLVLPCLLKKRSGKQVWRYKEHQDWHDLGFFSKRNASLSSNIPGKFKDVTSIFVNGSLTFSSFSSMLSGTYLCQSHNEGQVYHSEVKAVAVNCEKTVCEGDDAILECEVLKYKNLLYLNQTREIIWKKGRTTLANIELSVNVTHPNYTQPYIQGIDGPLNLGPASKAMDGQRYTCIVYGLEVTPRRYSVVVKVKNCQQKIIEACEGESIDLDCPEYPTIDKNTNDVRLEWYNGSTMFAYLHQGGATLSESSAVKVNESSGVATLVSVSVFDNGLYTCKALREGKLLEEYSVILNVTQCPSTTAYQNPKKEVQSKYLNKPSVAESTADEEATDVVTEKGSFPYGLLFVLVLPMLLCYIVMRRRQNDSQQQRTWV